MTSCTIWSKSGQREHSWHRLEKNLCIFCVPNVPGGPRKDWYNQDAKMLMKAKINRKRYEMDMLTVFSNLVVNWSTSDWSTFVLCLYSCWTQMCIDTATQGDPFSISCMSLSHIDAPKLSLPILASLLEIGKYTSRYWHCLKVSQHGSRCSLTIILERCPSALSTRAFK